MPEYSLSSKRIVIVAHGSAARQLASAFKIICDVSDIVKNTTPEEVGLI
jgi:bisphosphoglycerate-dependent phosphoglycerate mutase